MRKTLNDELTSNRLGRNLDYKYSEYSNEESYIHINKNKKLVSILKAKIFKGFSRIKAIKELREKESNKISHIYLAGKEYKLKTSKIEPIQESHALQISKIKNSFFNIISKEKNKNLNGSLFITQNILKEKKNVKTKHNQISNIMLDDYDKYNTIKFLSLIVNKTLRYSTDRHFIKKEIHKQNNKFKDFNPEKSECKSERWLNKSCSIFKNKIDKNLTTSKFNRTSGIQKGLIFKNRNKSKTSSFFNKDNKVNKYGHKDWFVNGNQSENRDKIIQIEDDIESISDSNSYKYQKDYLTTLLESKDNSNERKFKNIKKNSLNKINSFMQDSARLNFSGFKNIQLIALLNSDIDNTQ